ncbi:MAG: YhcH/YjgK/YiaL family protein [Clostridia bacterium]|nr:YhcH/YjgK/YiaL family protein [Clostridia bacterium]
MILDRIERLPLYEDIIPGAKAAADAFARGEAAGAPFEIREKAYAAKADEKRRFEVHAHTIDLMIAKQGCEVIHICPQEELTPAEPLPNGADGHKLDGAPRGTAVLLSEGWFCAICPGEAHMVAGKPDGKESAIEKWVVKLPC